jgi:hypothetical protein
LELHYSLSQLIRAHSLHNNTRRRTTTVANHSSAVLANLQLVQQCHQNPASGATQRVPEGNGASPWVHVVCTQTEDLGVCFDDGCEGFVELPDGDVVLGKTGLLEEFLDAGSGGDGEVDGVLERC